MRPPLGLRRKGRKRLRARQWLAEAKRLLAGESLCWDHARSKRPGSLIYWQKDCEQCQGDTHGLQL